MPMPGPDDMRRLNPSSAPRWDSCQGRRELPTPMDKAIDNDDRIWQERHQRRLARTRDVNRRVMWLWIVAFSFAVLAWTLL